MRRELIDDGLGYLFGALLLGLMILGAWVATVTAPDEWDRCMAVHRDAGFCDRAEP